MYFYVKKLVNNLTINQMCKEFLILRSFVSILSLYMFKMIIAKKKNNNVIFLYFFFIFRSRSEKKHCNLKTYHSFLFF